MIQIDLSLLIPQLMTIGTMLLQWHFLILSFEKAISMFNGPVSNYHDFNHTNDLGEQDTFGGIFKTKTKEYELRVEDNETPFFYDDDGNLDYDEKEFEKLYGFNADDDIDRTLDIQRENGYRSN